MPFFRQCFKRLGADKAFVTFNTVMIVYNLTQVRTLFSVCTRVWAPCSAPSAQPGVHGVRWMSATGRGGSTCAQERQVHANARAGNGRVKR